MKTTRASLTYILVSMVVGVILVSSIYQYWSQRKVIAEWSRDKAIAEIRLLTNDVSTVLTGVTRDLFTLRDLPQLHEHLNAITVHLRERTLSEVEEFYILFSQNKQIYDQIRFLNEKGKEIVRVNFNGDKAEAEGKLRLQDKSSRYYFKKSIDMEQGNIYISPMDLNVEHGVIEKPIKPVIRYATPVYDKDMTIRGIVVLNVKAQYVLDIIREHQKRATYGEKYFMLNMDGYYLLHPDRKKEWGFLLDKRQNILKDEPDLSPMIAESSQGFLALYNDELRKNIFYTYRRIYPMALKPTYQVKIDSSEQPGSNGNSKVANLYWVLLSAVDLKSLDPTFKKQTLSLLLFSGTLLVMGIILASLFAWRHSRPIQNLSNIATKIADGDFSARVKVSSQDEIGKLGNVFNEMADALEKRQEQEKVFQRRLQEETVLAQEKERRGIARDIHDHLGHNLAIVRMKLQELQAKLPDGKGKVEVEEYLNDSITLLKEMVQQTRTLIFDLYPIMLDDFGLAQTIEWHVNKFSSRTGLNSEFNQSGKIREPSRSVSIYLFRVIKELMNNALKHADADKIKVELIGSDSGMKVIVSDDGKGFNAESVFESAYDMRGLGLYSIREWVSGVGGQLKIESVSGKGTKVIIDILIDVKK